MCTWESVAHIYMFIYNVLSVENMLAYAKIKKPDDDDCVCMYWIIL